jgi:hypothetical protein
MEEMEGGTLDSFLYVKQENKPYLVLDMSVHTSSGAAQKIRKFVHRTRPAVLNFSGPRISEWPNGYAVCREILQKFLG